MENLNENSLYKNVDEKNLLLKDRKALATALLINYFGYLSLFATKIKPCLKEYKNNEKSLLPNMIGDDHNDSSLCVKMALDAHMILPSTANKLYRLLSQIKHNKIATEKDLDLDYIVELFTLCKFGTTNRVMPLLQPIVEAFIDGDINLPYLARDLYRKSMMPDIKVVASEFRSLFKLGAYNSLYNAFEDGTESIDHGVPEIYIKTRTDKTIPHIKVVKEVSLQNKYETLTEDVTDKTYNKFLPLIYFFNNEIDINSLHNDDFNALFTDDVLDHLMVNNFMQIGNRRKLDYNTTDVLKALNILKIKTILQADEFKGREGWVYKKANELEYLVKNYRRVLAKNNIVPNSENSEVYIKDQVNKIFKNRKDIKEFIVHMSNAVPEFKDKNVVMQTNDEGKVYFPDPVTNPKLYEMLLHIKELKIKNKITAQEYIDMQQKLPVAVQDMWLTEDYETFKYNFYNKWFLDDVDQAQLAMTVLASDLSVNSQFGDGFYNPQAYKAENGEKVFDYDVFNAVKDQSKDHIQALYEENQSMFKEKFGDNNQTIRLFRGLREIDDPSKYIPACVESWTDDIDIAMDFAGRGENSYIFAVDVPYKYILTNFENVDKTYKVQFMDEREYFLLGGALSELELMYDDSANAIGTLLESNHNKSYIADKYIFNPRVRYALGNDTLENTIKKQLRAK